MGTSSSAAHLAAKLASAGANVEAATRAGLNAGGMTVKTTAVAYLAAAGVGSGRLSGVGKRGGRIGVRYKIAQTGDGAVVDVGMTGPAQLIERDTKAHPIGPRKSKTLKLATGDFRPFVAHHPGTRGKHPWEKSLRVSLPLVPKIMQEHVSLGLVRAFR